MNQNPSFGIGSWIIDTDPNTKMGGLIVSGIRYTELPANFTHNNVVAVASILVPSHYLKVTVPDEPLVAHKVFPIQDDEDESIYHFFKPTYEFIDYHLQKGNVLVHCEAGSSRSPTIVCAYLMQKNKWSVNKALKHVQERRKSANPNKGFMKDLRKLEKTIQIDI
jgi:protein-tyrosine phosphatase